MKTEIIKQIYVRLEKDDKESIKKIITLINDLMDKGMEHDYDCYNINGTYREMKELENLVDLLEDLVFTEFIELV